MSGKAPSRWASRVLALFSWIPQDRLGGASLSFAILAVLPPTLDLLVLEFWHPIHNVAFLMLTPVFGTLAKIFAAGAYAHDQNKKRTLVVLILVGAGTLLLIAVGKLAGIQVRI